jgi:hypothetical protein
MRRAGCLAAGFAAMMILSTVTGFSRAQTQNRIPQQVVINGLTVNAATVMTAAGQIQSFTCSSPQHYTTVDGGSQGWACYEESTGAWLMHAVPPAQAPAAPASLPQQPSVYPPPAPVPQAPAPVYQQPRAPVYQPAPLPPVVYQTPPTLIYQVPPAVIYQSPAVVYASPVAPVVYAPVYSPSVVLGAAAITAVGRIASAAIIGSYYPRAYYFPSRGFFRRW